MYWGGIEVGVEVLWGFGVCDFSCGGYFIVVMIVVVCCVMKIYVIGKCC